MSNFWPKGIEVNDIQSPMQILETAQEEWEGNSNGVLTLLLQQTQSTSGDDMIIVHAKHVPSNRSITLFSIIYRSEIPYPVTIQPQKEELPNYLKKSYYQSNNTVNNTGSVSEIIKAAAAVSGNLSERRRIENNWVSDDPAEFRNKLEEAFNLNFVKSSILSLLSTVQGNTGITEELTEVD